MPMQQALLKEVANGNKEAFRQLFDNHRNKLYAYMLRLVEERSAAEDIVQETFLKIWLSRRELTEIKNFDAYLFTIARNHAFNLSKKIAYRRNLLEDHTATQPTEDKTTETEVTYKNLLSLLNNELNKLPPQQKRIFTLSRFDGLTNEDIARQQDISVTTVKKHLSLATQTLRNLMKDNLEIIIILTIVSKEF
jgi:RNA polymerase sigma-70 factor (ECF subfamily)